MNRVIEPKLDGNGLRIAIVASRFNDAITDRLLSGALASLRRYGVADDAVTVVRVPGAFELPIAARALAASGEHDGIVALGCLIRGETSHYDVLATEVTASLGRVSELTGVPLAFGVLTCETLEQAINRAGGKGSNKGADVAAVAVEMCNLLKELKADRRA